MNYTPPTRLASILLLSDVETLLAISRPTLRKMVRKGELPLPRECGKAVYWRRDELETTLAKAPAAKRWPGPGAVETRKPSQEGAEAA